MFDETNPPPMPSIPRPARFTSEDAKRLFELQQRKNAWENYLKIKLREILGEVAVTRRDVLLDTIIDKPDVILHIAMLLKGGE